MDKELDNVKKEVARNEKKFEDKLKAEKQAAKLMSENNVKLKTENANLQKLLETLKRDHDSMKDHIEGAEEAANIIKSLQVQLVDR